jgi:cellulose synthase/poly-beta-1,6-N-acetylglucosamine synthase-like glycosyltransferase
VHAGLKCLFWLSTAIVAYVYVVYPIVIWLMARARPRPERKATQLPDCPPIAIVMAVHNEESRIALKLENLRGLRYPGRARIIVVSDGSTDGTNAYLAAQSDVRFVQLKVRTGKAAALNAAMQMVTEQIVVFTDVRQLDSSLCRSSCRRS